MQYFSHGESDVGSLSRRLIALDGSATRDPDGNQLALRRFVYPEAGLTGTHGTEVEIVNDQSRIAKVSEFNPNHRIVL